MGHWALAPCAFSEAALWLPSPYPRARGGPGRPFARPTAGPVLVVCLLCSVLNSVVAEIRPPEALPYIFRNPSTQGVPLGIRATRDKLAMGGLWGVLGG